MEEWLKSFQIRYVSLYLLGAGILLFFLNLAIKPLFILRYKGIINEAYQVVQDMEIDRNDFGDDELEILDEYNRYVNISIMNAEGSILYGTRNKNFTDTEGKVFGQNKDQYMEDAEAEIVTVFDGKVTGLSLYGLLKTPSAMFYIYIHKSIHNLNRIAQAARWTALIAIIMMFIAGALAFMVLSHRCFKPVCIYAKSVEMLAQDDISGQLPIQPKDTNNPVFIKQAEDLIRKMIRIHSRIKNYEYIFKSAGPDGKSGINSQKKLVSHVTHQLKTPLAIISSQIELDHCETDSSKKEKYYTSILEEIDKMSLLIDNILRDYEKEQVYVSVSLRRTNISDTLIELVPKYENWLRINRIRFSTQIDPDLYSMADPIQIEQAVHNFMMNAVDHTRKDKEIRLTLRREEKDNLIIVHNEGNGISEEELKNIWNRGYYRIPDVHSHTGLGLYIVKLIAAQHRGSCSAYNDRTGVCFVLRIPEC